MEDMKIICADCNSPLPNQNDKCKKCGSTKKIIEQHFEDKISIHESIRCQNKDKTKNSKNNPVLDVFQGDQIQKCTGEWVNKKKNNRQNK